MSFCNKNIVLFSTIVKCLNSIIKNNCNNAKAKYIAYSEKIWFRDAFFNQCNIEVEISNGRVSEALTVIVISWTLYTFSLLITHIDSNWINSVVLWGSQVVKKAARSPYFLRSRGTNPSAKVFLFAECRFLFPETQLLSTVPELITQL